MTRKARAVLIGASSTANSPPVLAAVTVVNKVSALLTQQFGANATIAKLVDNDATHTKVTQELAAARTAASDGELFVLLFAGHGLPATDQAPFQSWALKGMDRFTDIELAQQLLAFTAKVDTVVISACCYGEGLFKPGPFSNVVHHPWSPHLTPHELDIKFQLRIFNQRRITFLKSAFAAKNAPMVCISAAAKQGQALAGVLDELASDIALATKAQNTYQQLADKFDEDAFAGRAFQVDARPSTRMNDVVLAAQ